jgi:hypothetical protein
LRHVRTSHHAPTGPTGPTAPPTLRLVAGFVAASFLALYVSRLCPDLNLTGDSAELVTAAAVWGVPHPPGYPLYTAIGHAFAALPTHSLPWRVHLTSAVFHAGAVGAVCMASFALTESLTGAALAGFALGISRTFVLGSLYAEVFPLNDLFFACLLALGLASRRSPQGAPPKGLFVFSVCAGLAFSHHLMLVLGAPALAMLVGGPVGRLVRGHRWRALGLGLALLAPLLIYALIPLAASRAPAISWGDVHDAGSLLRLVTRQDYGGPFSATRTPTSQPSLARLGAFASLVARSMGALSIALALLGLGRELWKERTVGASLLLAFLVPGPLFAWANALGTGSEETLAYFERFTSMCHVALAVAVGSGVAFLQSAVGAKRYAALALSLALGLWGLDGARRARDVDLSTDRRGIAFAHDLVRATPDHSLILLSGDEPGSAALYVCAVEQACGRRIVLSPGSLFLPWRMAQARARYPDLDIPWSAGPALRRTHELAAAAIDSRAVFVSPTLFEKDPVLGGAFSSLPDRLLFRLWPHGTATQTEQEAFLASARAMASKDGCEGCSLAAPISPRPSQDVEIAKAYEAAFTNHARAARLLPGAVELTAALDARSRAFAAAIDQGGGVSISR